MVWLCFPLIRSGQNHLARHSERGKKTRQTGEEVGRQHQGMDRPGVRQVPEGSGEQGKMEKSGCKIICGAPTTLAVKGLMMMIMMSCGGKRLTCCGCWQSSLYPLTSGHCSWRPATWSGCTTWTVARHSSSPSCVAVVISQPVSRLGGPWVMIETGAFLIRVLRMYREWRCSDRPSKSVTMIQN